MKPLLTSQQPDNVECELTNEFPVFKLTVLLWHAIERLNENHQPADLTGILKELKSNGRMLTEKEILTSLEYLDASGQVTRTSENQFAVVNSR